MDLRCEFCGTIFTHDKTGARPKYCPECREHYEDIYRERRAAKREAKRQRKAVLNPGPAHRLGMSEILRELEQFNAARRAEGLPVVTYGRYVAMRDGKSQSGTGCNNKNAGSGRFLSLPASGPCITDRFAGKLIASRA